MSSNQWDLVLGAALLGNNRRSGSTPQPLKASAGTHIFRLLLIVKKRTRRLLGSGDVPTWPHPRAKKIEYAR